MSGAIQDRAHLWSDDNVQLSSEPRTRVLNADTYDPCVARYLLAARAENTRRAYAADIAHFVAWGGSLPSSPEEIARYLAGHAEYLKPTTLVRRLAALATTHRDRGLADPTKHPLVHRVIQGITRCHASAPRRVEPLLIGELANVVSRLGDSLEDLRDRATLSVGFFGAFRRSELAALDCESVETIAGGALVCIDRSKTDSGAKGRIVLLARREDGLCPVRAIHAWQFAAELSKGPLFRRVAGSGVGGRVTGADVARTVKKCVARAGFDPCRFSGHSLRAGFATSAALAGFDAVAIARQTGHRSSRALAAYVRPVGLSLPKLLETP